jgi:hypothetical protein
VTPDLPEVGVIGRLAQWIARHPRAWVILTILTLAAALAAASRLRVDADLGALLPDDSPRLAATRALERDLGAASSVAVLLEDAPPDDLIALGHDLAPALEVLPHVRLVEWRRPVDFFAARAPYYAPLETLEELERRVERRRRWEVKRNSPLFVPLSDATPPEVGARALLEGALPDGWTERPEPYLIDRDARALALIVHPDDSVGVDMARQRDLHDAVVATTRAQLPAEVRARFGGGVSKTLAQQSLVERDMGWVTLLGLLAICAYLGWYFRRAAALGLLVTPLVVGLIWTMGFAGAVFGTLSVITAFVSVMLLGLGIDHGIHLLDRYQRERATHTPERALARAFDHSGGPVLIAAWTTLVGFGALGASGFRAFHEFGAIAAFGMGAIALAYVTSLPALLPWCERRGLLAAPPEPRAARAFYRAVARRPGAWLAAASVALALAAWRAPDLRFEYSWRALGGDSEPFQVDDTLRAIQGHGHSRVYLHARDRASRDALVDALAAREDTLNPSTRVDTTRDLVPDDQRAKHDLLTRLHDRVAPWPDVDLPWPRDAGPPPPFGFDDLPDEVRLGLAGRTPDLHERLVMLRTGEDLDDARVAGALADDLDGLADAQGRPHLILGIQMIAVDVVRAVQREATPTLLGVLLALGASLLLGLRRARGVLVCLGTAGATLLAGAGAMAWLGLTLNYFNMVLVAVTAGMAVDGAIHLVWMARRPDWTTDDLAAVSRANVGALLTTATGFGALWLAGHPGVASMGAAAWMGLGASIALDGLALPAGLLWARRRSARRGAAPS